jgi:hypothetical protein
MKLFATAVALTGAFAAQTNSTVGLHGAVPNGDFCSIIAGDLPSFCQCANTAGGLNTTCTVAMLGDTVFASVVLNPCDAVADASLEISEADLGIDFKMGPYKAGTSESIPVPGLSIDFGIVSVGVVADVAIDGNADALALDIEMDGCVSATIITPKECGSDITGSGLPIPLLKETYDFSSLCTRR